MKNYLQIEIAGEKVGLKFSYDGFKDFMLAHEKNPGVYWRQANDDKPDETSFTVAGFAKLVQTAYIANCQAKEVTPVINYETFYDFIDDCQYTEEGQKITLEISQTFAECNFVKQTIAAAQELEKKSQLTASQ